MSDQQAAATVESESPGSGTALVSAPAKRPAPKKNEPKQLPPFKVLLHNDDVNTFEHIIASILKVTSLQVEDAVLKTVEAHETGVSLLLITHKERAELFAEQFSTFNITVTIEPDA